jgi:hypothetical protein
MREAERFLPTTVAKLFPAKLILCLILPHSIPPSGDVLPFSLDTIYVIIANFCDIGTSFRISNLDLEQPLLPLKALAFES